MEQHSQYPTVKPSPWSQRIPKFSNIAGVLAAIASATLIFLTVAGYGTLQLENIPAGTVVRLNGNVIPTTSLRLRPGNYRVGIISPITAPYEGVVHISLFRRTAYRPRLDQRDVDAIASSVLGAVPNTSQTPQFQTSEWFDNNTWLAGSFTPSGIIAVFQYDSHQKWTLAFCSDDSCPQDQTKLPANIIGYVQMLMATSAPEKVAE